MKRIGQVVRLKPEHYEEYKRIHAAVWPEVLAAIHAANIRNYSIFHLDGLLFAYFEYVGNDYEGDMATIAADPKTREWWLVTDPMQRPYQGNSTGSVDGNWWTPAEEVFHND
jgi:L-rhamnose mutarotase